MEESGIVSQSLRESGLWFLMSCGGTGPSVQSGRNPFVNQVFGFTSQFKQECLEKIKVAIPS